MAPHISDAEGLKRRFWAKIDASPGHGPEGDCHVWTGYRMPQGNGQIQTKQNGQWKLALVHHVAWWIAHNEWPLLYVLHRCDNPPCCNPLHLFAGTQADNVADMNAKGRNGNVRIPAETIRAIAEAVGTQREIATRFGVGGSSVCRIRQGAQ